MGNFSLSPPTETNSINEEALTVDIVSNGYGYESSSIEMHTIESCCIVSIISPHAFTIQLTRDVLSSDAFFKAMTEYYNSIEDLQIPREHLRPNLLCVTYDERTGIWSRSQIMEYDLDKDTVNVFFVDLNSWEENVSRSRLRFILTKYSSRAVDSLTCRLASIAPLDNNNQWNDVVRKTFENLIEKRQCDVELLYKRSDDMFYVNLFAQHKEAYVCINDFLIHCQMAKPINDTADEEQIIYVLDEDGKPMHAMLALYWKSEEMNHDLENATETSQSNESVPIPVTKVFLIDENYQMVFARYKNYVMIPCFVLSRILNESNEEKIDNLAQKYGFKPLLISPTSHPFLSSQLAKFTSQTKQIHLYSIDCVRKILQTLDYHQTTVFDLLDQARLAEANNDTTFWELDS